MNDLRCLNCGRPFRYPGYRSECFECGGDDFHWASLLDTAALGACLLLLMAWRFGWL